MNHLQINLKELLHNTDFNFEALLDFKNTGPSLLNKYVKIKFVVIVFKKCVITYCKLKLCKALTKYLYIVVALPILVMGDMAMKGSIISLYLAESNGSDNNANMTAVP